MVFFAQKFGQFETAFTIPQIVLLIKRHTFLLVAFISVYKLILEQEYLWLSDKKWP